jgi:hypothetical protein
VFIFLVENSALSDKQDTKDIIEALNEKNTYFGSLKSLEIYEGDQLYYIARDVTYYYVYNEDLKQVKRVDISSVKSQVEVKAAFQNSFDILSLGYSKETDCLIYEFKVVLENSVGYYYYDAKTVEFVKFYVLGGKIYE